MKNSILYSIIGLMCISLVGIIWIQSTWIKGAIGARKKDFGFHVNLALNKVNAEIEKEEAVVILERKLGNVDSLLETLVVFNDIDSHELNLNLAERELDSDHQIEIKIEENGPHAHRVHTQVKRRIDAWVEDERHLHGPPPHEERREEIERRVVRLKEASQQKEKHMKAMFRHLSYERMFGGELKDRISKEELSKKIRLALNQEGIVPNFEFAVFNRKKGEFEKGYRSSAFNPKEEAIRKTLFANDLHLFQDYELWLQPKDQGTYIWSGVQQMTLLSLLFTLLIILAFGTSIYFIWKQKKISQVKNDFINNMTHELKTPLASISLASSSIAHPEIIQQPDEIRKYTSIIKEEEQRINAHVERVLNIAALDRGEFELNKTEIDFLDLVQNACRSFELALQDKKGSFHLTQKGTDFTLIGDAFHLLNVCSNLLDNAIKYSDNGVRIDVTLHATPNSVKAEFTDTGIGMSAREQKLAFDKFYRAETGNIHTQKGFGLGLSYVKSIVERHKGTIQIKSQKGMGTTVTLEVPKK